MRTTLFTITIGVQPMLNTFQYRILLSLFSIILLLSITGCKAKSGSEVNWPVETAGEPVSAGLLYTNTKYGFSLDFPSGWKSFTFKEDLVDYGSNIKAPVIYFGLPDQEDIFAVGIYTREQWNKLAGIEGPDGKAGATPLSRNNVYLFDYSAGHYAVNEEIQKRRLEINDIMATIKVTDIK
ncbi:MAG: hypothetical protein JXB88_23160 [Spirochaetales bacterium]|nr:hypothetical protein [Spirochaetales bacterium]